MADFNSKTRITQKDVVLDYLRKNKRITSWFAIQEFGITRLADIVHRLKKDGHNINTTMMGYSNAKTGNSSSYAKYTYLGNVTIGDNYSLALT